MERANRTQREEFYEVEDTGLTLDEHNKQLERWTDTYNTILPHQSRLKEHRPKASIM